MKLGLQGKRARRKPARKLKSFQIELLEPRYAFSHNGDGLLHNWVMSPEEEQLVLNALAGDGEASANPFTPFTYSTLANGMPILDSLPGAPAAIFLDFDGDAATGTDPYSTEGDGSTFSVAEQGHIVEAWRQVSIYFAMFNISVITVQNDALPLAWIAIGNNINNAYSGVNVFPDNNQAESWSQSSYARTRISALTHELGHNFGNWHTSQYDNLGNKTAEYSNLFDPLHGPLMGLDYSGIVHKWTNWHSSLDAATMQDDMSFMAADIGNLVPVGHPSRDGYRADDYAGTIATATPLFTSGNTRSIVGIIERLDDADMFSFVSTGGNYNISVGRDNPSGVDTKVTIYDAAGNMLAFEDGDPNKVPYTMVYDSQISLNLAAGTYYIKVECHGNYGDQGQYIVRVDPLANNWIGTDIGLPGVSGYSAYNSATGTYTVAGSGDDIWNTSDSFQFLYQTLTGDGSITAKVTGIVNTSAHAKAGVMIRESLNGDSRNVYLELKSGGSTNFQRRTATGGSSSNTVGANASWLRLTRVGNTITAFISTDGVIFNSLGSVSIAMGSTVYIGLATTAQNNLRLNTATYSNVTLTGNLNALGYVVNPNLTLPTNVTTSNITSTSMSVSWTKANLVGDTNADGKVDIVDYNNVKNNFGGTGTGDTNGDGIVDITDFNNVKNKFGIVAGAPTGYIVERSLDGINYTQVGVTASTVTTFTDSGLSDALRYFYRVRASNSSGSSLPSLATTAVTRAGVVSNLNIISYSTTQLVLDWFEGSGETGYRIERSANGVDGWINVTTRPKNVQMYTNGGLSAGTQYFYRVVTVDALGDSVISPVKSAFTRLAAPTLSFVSKASNQMVISWTASTGAAGYLIERSNNRTDWTTVASNQVGTTYTDNAITPVEKYYYRVTALSATNSSLPSNVIFAASPAASALPSPWISSDIGSVGGTGAAGVSGGTVTIIGGGADIWGSSDEFRFTFFEMSGNVSITARVLSVEHAGAYSRAGIMVRDSTNTGSRYFAMMVHQDDANGVRAQYRTSTNGGAGETLFNETGDPYWVRITRTGSSFVGEASPDGVTWTTVHTRSISMTGTVFVGLALTPRDDSYLNKAVYTNVSVTNSSGAITLSSGSSSAASSSESSQASALPQMTETSQLLESSQATSTSGSSDLDLTSLRFNSVLPIWNAFSLTASLPKVPTVLQATVSSTQQSRAKLLSAASVEFSRRNETASIALASSTTDQKRIVTARGALDEIFSLFGSSDFESGS